MTDKVFAKPKKGLTVPKPDGVVLAADGENVKRGMYWLRRERDGDVVLSAPKQASEKTSVKQPVKAD